ncbi:MAG TPA: hypothetical protein VK168_12595 [Saprospiraceae bacterium]|nr:hypothetical protein [Saprospiraceae bacterium]
MQNIHSVPELKVAILALEKKQAEEAGSIREQLMLTRETLRPANLIQHSLTDLFEGQAFKGNMLNTSIGLTAGVASKLLYEHGTRNPIKRIIGNVILFGVTNLVGKNIEPIKSVAGMLFKMLRSKNPVPEKS